MADRAYGTLDGNEAAAGRTIMTLTHINILVDALAFAAFLLLALGAVGFGALVFFVAAPWLSRVESKARQQSRIEAAQTSA